jgi:DNA recombination protein RmuC
MSNIELITYLLSFIIFLLVIIIYKVFFLWTNNSNKHLVDNLILENKNSNLNFLKEILREFGTFSWNINEKISSKFIKIIEKNKESEINLIKNLESFLKESDKKLSTNLDQISDKVDKKLESGFEKTNKTFNDIISRLAKIDEAQKNIDKLNNEVVSLQNVLTDNKTRWIFWEVQLQSILESIFWEKNDKLYQMQYHFKSNNSQVDAVIKTSKWLICIDAKFPLENYRKMNDKSLLESEKKDAEKLFIAWIKKQVIEISSKYIIKWETLEQAFLFLPAEAIFAEINAYYPNIIDFAQKNNISIVSPTTLMAMLTIIKNAIKSLETQKQAQVIQTELIKLSEDFGRFETRWNKFTKNFKNVWKDIDDIDITNKKIISRFWSVERLELEEK